MKTRTLLVIGIFELLFIIGIIGGFIYLIVYLVNKNKKKNKGVQEGFGSIPESILNKSIESQYGNIIYNSQLKNVKKNTMIVLPGRYKITGIKVSGDTNPKTISSKYKVYIADNEEDIANPDVRKLVSCDDKGGSVLDINTLYNSPSNFEKEGNGLFVGKVLLITTDDSNSDIKDIKPLPSTLDVMVLGLEPFALSFQDYNKFMNVELNKTNKKSKNVKVGYIQLTGDSIPGDYRIKYSNTIDNNSNKYAIEGPNKLAFQVPETDHPFIFFSKPIIVNKIYINKDIIPTTTNTTTDNGITYDLYGSETVSKRDEANFKLQQQAFDEKHLLVGGEKCPNVGEMINKQLQAQQICEALEYKDKARNKKLAYEKDKIYLGKLAKQDQEIEELENIVKGLIERKNNRIENNQGSNIDELEKEMRRVEQIREDAEAYLKSSNKPHSDLRLKVNLDPEFKNIKSKVSLKK